MRRLLLMTTLFLLYGVGLAVGPRVPDDEQLRYCVKNIYLPGPFGISLNCDSPVFLEDAANPRLLLAENAVYQGRPLHITLVGAIGYPLRLLTTPLLRALNLDQQLGFGLDIIGKENPYRATTFTSEADVAAGIALFVPYFLAYVLGNVLLLIGAFWLYLRLVLPEGGWRDAPLAVLLTGLLLAFNDLAKAYLLMPHSQMFSLFVPLLAVFAFRELATAPSRRRVLLVGGLAGFGVLAYAYFAVLVPVSAVALLVHARSRGGWRQAVRRVGPDVLWMTLLALLPAAGWVGFVILRNGAFFSFEVACCRQIVWIADAWSAGGAAALLAQFGSKLAFFLRTAAGMSVLPLLLASLLLALGWPGRRQWSLNAHDRLALGGAACVVVCSLLFFSVLGYTVTRLATGIAVPLLVGVGVLAREGARGLSERARWWLESGAAVGVIGILLLTLLKNGPYS